MSNAAQRSPDLLLLNANTDTDMTGRMLTAAQKRHPFCRAATVTHGAKDISDETAAHVAAHAVADFAAGSPRTACPTR